MNPQLPNFVRTLFKDILARPHQAASILNKHIVRNRALSSNQRRRCQQWLLDGIRWRYDWELWLSAGVLTFDEFDQKLIRLKRSLLQSDWQDVDEFARAFSMPAWMVQALSQTRSLNELAKLLLMHVDRPPLVLRVNTWQASVEDVYAYYRKEDLAVDTVDACPYALTLPAGTQLQGTLPVKKGWVEVQDLASQYLAAQMNLERWQTIVDGCARTGGKALAMASHMQGQGTFHLLDVDARLLDKTKKRMQHAGLDNVHIGWVAQQDAQPMPALENKADVVLVDAPCSSIGTLARRPWLKWQLQAQTVQKYANIQLDILTRQARWVKPGGQLVYATCSWFAQENQQVIQAFLAQHSGFALKHQFHAEDVLGESNGFYGAYMHKAE